MNIVTNLQLQLLKEWEIKYGIFNCIRNIYGFSIVFNFNDKVFLYRDKTLMRKFSNNINLIN